MTKTEIAKVSDLKDRNPAYALVGEVDLVDGEVSTFYGRCLHRGALMADGFVRGNSLICGVHNWDYRTDTGVSEYNNEEVRSRTGGIPIGYANHSSSRSGATASRQTKTQ